MKYRVYVLDCYLNEDLMVCDTEPEARKIADMCQAIFNAIGKSLKCDFSTPDVYIDEIESKT